MEKKYIIATVRAESKEIISIEILDESSVAPILKTAFFRLGLDEFQALGRPTAGDKLKVTVEVEKSS